MSEYAERDIIALGEYYTKHVSAMTGEQLHSKSDIAAELAYRDAELKRLNNEVNSLKTQAQSNESILASYEGITKLLLSDRNGDVGYLYSGLEISSHDEFSFAVKHKDGSIFKVEVRSTKIYPDFEPTNEGYDFGLTKSSYQRK